MANLSTRYLGIELKNPVIVGASNLVTNIDNIKKAEDSGAAAIVYKSLFEEQIQLEQTQFHDELTEYNERHAEMVDLFPDIKHAGPSEHLNNVRKAKEAVSIPIIASLNAIYKESWIEYAQMLEQTGVDALELNFYSVPRGFDSDSAQIEKDQIDLLQAVIQAVKIPVSVKLSPFYANPLGLIKKMDETHVKGFVLFNRMFQPDIDIIEERHVTSFNLSSENDNRLAIRFAGLLYGNISANICSNTGIFTGMDLVKVLLAGADCGQVVSTIYHNKISYLGTIVNELEQWMNMKEYKSLNDFQGKLSNQKLNDPFIYKRAQYVDLLLKSSEIFNTNTLR